MNKDIFQKELLEAPVSFLVSKWVIDRVPYVFNDDREEYIFWKEELAKKLKIDGKAIIFTGSSGCGFSLNPLKNYKDFNGESDIDIALISQLHFDIAWHYLRNLGSSRMGLTNKQKASVRDHVTRLIYWGTIGTDKILEILPFGKSWVLALEEMKNIAPIEGRTINIRIYKDFEALRAYQTNGFETLRTELLSTDEDKNEHILEYNP